jgi:hypothetical protein
MSIATVIDRLDGYTFSKNNMTNNSWTIHPPAGMTPPARINITNYRTRDLFYNKNLNGYSIGLLYGYYLTEMGAIQTEQPPIRTEETSITIPETQTTEDTSLFLRGWSFKMNTSTMNSYTLMPLPGTIPEKELAVPFYHRPLYYSSHVGGYSVRLTAKSDLENHGAVCIDIPSM